MKEVPSMRSNSKQPEYPGVDRADLLIMCNKIKEDVQRSLSDIVIPSHRDQSPFRSNGLKTVTYRTECQPISTRENMKDMRLSIDQYKKAYNIDTVKNSPAKRVKHNNSKMTSARRSAFNSDSNISVGRTIEPKIMSNLPGNKFKTSLVNSRQVTQRFHEPAYASFSPFSNNRSKEKDRSSTQKRLKSKKALSKLDSIYKELQQMDNMFSGPRDRL